MKHLLESYLVVPGAHVRIGEFHYQAELYDVFHLSWGSRLGHIVCTPLVILGALLALDAIPMSIAGDLVSGVPVGGLVLAVGLCAYFFGLDALVGLATAPLVAALLFAALGLSELLGEQTLVAGLAMMGVGAVVQAGSHLFEDMPPPWGAPRTWRPMGEVLREATPRKLLSLSGLVLVSFALEWWASFRILGLQVNFLLMRAGLRPELVKHIERRRSEILAGNG